MVGLQQKIVTALQLYLVPAVGADDLGFAEKVAPMWLGVVMLRGSDSLWDSVQDKVGKVSLSPLLALFRLNLCTCFCFK